MERSEPWRKNQKSPERKSVHFRPLWFLDIKKRGGIEKWQLFGKSRLSYQKMQEKKADAARPIFEGGDTPRNWKKVLRTSTVEN